MVYLRTMRVNWSEKALGIEVQVSNGDTGAALPDVTIDCEVGCGMVALYTTDSAGQALLTPEVGSDLLLSVHHPEFNSRRLWIEAPLP